MRTVRRAGLVVPGAARPVWSAGSWERSWCRDKDVVKDYYKKRSESRVVCSGEVMYKQGLVCVRK